MKHGILLALFLCLAASPAVHAEEAVPLGGLKHAVYCPPFKGEKEPAAMYHAALLEALQHCPRVDLITESSRRKQPRYTYRLEGHIERSATPDAPPMVVVFLRDLARDEVISSRVAPALGGRELTQWKKSMQHVMERVAAALPFECHIGKTDRKQKSYSLDRGLSAGLQPGMVLNVAEAEDELISPASGRPVGRNAPRAFGQIRIFRVEENGAYARPVEGTVFPRGRGLHFVAQEF